jgi:hypothetical protein
MDVENYSQKLNAFHSLSPGFTAYISTIAKKTAYKSGQTVFLTREDNNFYPMIESGSLRLMAIDKDNDEELVIRTYNAEEFLYHFPNVMPRSRFELYVEFLQDSYLIAFSEKHYSNLLKLFPDAYLLNLSYTAWHLNIQLELLVGNNKIPDR